MVEQQGRHPEWVLINTAAKSVLSHCLNNSFSALKTRWNDKLDQFLAVHHLAHHKVSTAVLSHKSATEKRTLKKLQYSDRSITLNANRLGSKWKY